MKILIWPDPKLKVISAKVEQTPNPSFIKELFDTVKQAGGVGLSSIQVGIPARLFVLWAGSGEEVYINPTFVELRGERIQMIEGCLSTPGQFDKVSRWTEAEIKYQDVDMVEKTAVLSGLRAHAAQHEMEHLEGKMWTDHLPKAVRGKIMGEMLKYKRKGTK